jgi:hypothetical protein
MEEKTVLCHNHRNCKFGCCTWTELGFLYKMAKIKYFHNYDMSVLSGLNLSVDVFVSYLSLHILVNIFVSYFSNPPSQKS